MFMGVAGTGQVPVVLNLGSGKDFRSDAFNIDIDSSWAPDAVLDLSAVDLGPDGLTLSTERFGHVTLTPGYFQRIIANDVLEHVPNLMRLMTSCLNLLQVDGVFEISVPYDLSLGAWQDPTHVRGFNERSWLYYTDWFWYMGWDEVRFVTDTLNWVPSSLGEELRQKGVPSDEIIRTPRAIDSMSVRLRKIVLTPDDQATWQHWRERREASARNNRRGALILAAAAQEPAVAGRRPFGLKAFAGDWSTIKDRMCIWIVSPKDYTHHRAFNDMAAALSEAVGELGGSAPVVSHPSQWAGRTPLVLAPHLLSPNMSLILPPDSILFNLEQVDRHSSWMTEQYLSLLGRFPVLDYSVRNADALRRIGIGHTDVLSVGYAPGLERVVRLAEPDIDVLFYGSMNERRKVVLEALSAKGVTVMHLFDCYGAERDAAIARSRIVLNLHYYEAGIFESVRVNYLLANRACVVSEGEADDPDLAPYRDGLAVCSYDEIVECCLALLCNPQKRAALAERGYDRATAHRQSDILRKLVVSSATLQFA